MLLCNGVAEQRRAYLDSSASPEALGDLGGSGVSFASWPDPVALHTTDGSGRLSTESSPLEEEEEEHT
ncbi:jg26657 [Pararge aegeria aegeria]|uniref:Jg26657 protein n=1 Tax=Pararge aegeria aegeria TaxID=348720 RepID=A0A8S4QLR7_9NEOP|nr:jg26657 [Pararge aegeria aegeria]